MRFILLSNKPWHSDLFERLSKRPYENWKIISKKEDFNLQFLGEFKPDKIFIPHWSHIIEEDIHNNYECIVFHMTELPYGRGGSPLQNLIVRGKQKTKISAIRVIKEIDAGDVYLKKNLELKGTAHEIFKNASLIIEEMILDIIKGNFAVSKQKGKVTHFKRRTPKDGNIEKLSSKSKIFDYIRMLDAPTYPKAFIELENFKIEFSKANYSNNKLIAHVEFIEK